MASILLRPETLACVATGLVIAWAAIAEIRSRAEWSKINVPSDVRRPFLGTLGFTKSKPQTRKSLREKMLKYGPSSVIWIFSFPVVFLSHPEDLKRLLSGEFAIKGSALKGFTLYLGNGLVNIDHNGPNLSPWKKHRLLLNQAFKLSSIRILQEAFQRHASALVERLLAKVDQQVDLHKEFTKTTLDIITEIIGVRDAPEEFKQAVVQIVAHIDAGILAFLPGVMYLRHLQFSKAFGVFDSYAYQSIRNRREELRNGREAGREEGPKTLLDLMLNAEEDGIKLTEVEIRDHMLMLFFAGHETTSNTLSFLHYELSRHPEVRARLIEEMLSQPFPLTSDSQKNLKFTMNCINETLRLYPPAIGIPRVVPRPFQLTEGSVLPSDTITFLDLYSLHHSDAYWTNPEEFIPDRFEETEGHPAEPSHTFAFLPFGAGQRICIGKNLAWAEIFTILHTIYQKVRFEAVDDPENGALHFGSGVLSPKKVCVYVRKPHTKDE